MSALRRLIAEKRVIVCCGAGGVGKTTTSAAIALAGVRLGRRVLVLTIDPSKRLAEALGVSPNLPAPVAVSPERLRAAGVSAGPAGGSLEAWMLDPKAVSDQTVRKLVKDEKEAQRFLDNRIYQQISQMVAGMQEYTAMKALHRFTQEATYDLIVLDTPPSRHALDFLEAPSRFGDFLEGRVFKLFLPDGEPSKGRGFFARAASGLVQKVLSGVFSEDFASELTTFFGAFGGILGTLNRDLREIRSYLKADSVSFLLVTSPLEEALAEAFFFQEKTKELGLPFEGFVLNRSRVDLLSHALPGRELLATAAGHPHPEHARSALEKLAALGELELGLARADLKVLERLRARAGERAIAEALPWLAGMAEGIGMLSLLSARMTEEPADPRLKAA